MSEHNQDKHKARQQKVKEQVDAKIEQAQEEKGILQVITGNGKGKSTSGFGTVARCVGHGMNAAWCSLLKACGSAVSVTYWSVQVCRLPL